MQKEKENKYDDFFKESNIIKLEDKKFILNCLPNKPNKTKLLYDSKIHGDKANTFHSKCDGKFPTIYIVKTKTGYIFGGYLSKPWKSQNEFFEDNEAFFFNTFKEEIFF